MSGSDISAGAKSGAAKRQPSSGLQSLIPRWAYRHLGLCALGHFAGGGVAVAAGALCLSYGAYGWAALFLVGAAVALPFGWWYLTVARDSRS